MHGSTLVETLVMMLVAGIVFLSVMDGLTLFTRLQTRRAEALLEAGRQRDGYYRFIALVSGADSILPQDGGIGLYRAGRQSTLSLRDSALIYTAGDFRDTLMTGAGLLRLWEYDDRPDTVEVWFGFQAKFPVGASRRMYGIAMDEIEKEYGCEE